MTKDRTAKRAIYIPEGAMKISDKKSTAVAHIYENAFGQPCAVGFHGRAGKPDWNYRFRSNEEREKRIREHFAAWRRDAEYKAEQRAKRNAKGRGVKVGDVLRASWGYEQTNIDYYEVTKLIGKTMVEIREIAQEREGTEWAQGKCVPVPGKYVSEPMRKKAVDGYVKISSCEHAYKVEPKAMIGDKPVFEASHFTAYH